MPGEITWLPGAVKDVARLRNFIKSKNPIAAQRAANRIVEGIMNLKTNPGAGVPVEALTDYRDLILSFGSGETIIRYREENKKIVIVRVRNSKEEEF